MTTSDSRFVSPNEMFEAAKELQLEGREPETVRDWYLIANFFAFNIQIDSVQPALRVMGMIFDMPIPTEQLDKIAEFQINKRREQA